MGNRLRATPFADSPPPQKADNSFATKPDISIYSRHYLPPILRLFPVIPQADQYVTGLYRDFEFRLEEYDHEQPEPEIAQPVRPRLIDAVRNAIRRKHYSQRTEETYVHWIKRFIYFHGKRHPREMGASGGDCVSQSSRRRIAMWQPRPRTRRSLRCCFSTRRSSAAELPWLDGVERAKRPARLPSVLTAAEVGSIARAHDRHASG